MSPDRALADTSVFIGGEQRRYDCERLPGSLAVSVVTIGELKAGLLAAETSGARSARLRTLTDALALDPLPIDDSVADAWADLRIALRDAGLRTPRGNDSWIAATAIAHKLPLATQDDDFDDVPGLELVKL